MFKLETVQDYYNAGYDNGKHGVPAPAPGFAPTSRKREAYMTGWHAGRENRNGP